MKSDTTLLAEYLRTNDAVAFDQLARRYRGLVFATARRVTGNHHDAEDVAQGCFLELAKKPEMVRNSVAGFLHTAATHRSIDLLRERARRHKLERKAATEHIEPARNGDPAEQPWNEISTEVDDAIEQLPDELRTLVILYYLRGLSDADIAVELGMNRKTVMRRLSVGVRMLRAALTKRGMVVSLAVLTVGLRTAATQAAPASLTAATGRMALTAALRVPGAPPQVFPKPLMLLRSLAWLLVPGYAAPITVGAVVLGWGIYAANQVAAPGPYDRMRQIYASYLPNNPVSGFQWHMASIKSDMSSFWRGAQPLFFEWCKTNCRDWLNDQDGYALCDASPNLEDAERLAQKVNSDNSARLPVQIELLQGLITVRLAANGGFSAPQDRTAVDVAKILCDSYRATLSQANLGTMPAVEPYEDRDKVQDYLDPATGDFRAVILRNDRIYHFLIPTPLTCKQATAMVASAMARNEALRRYMDGAGAEVRSVRQLVRYDSVVTQGQAEYLAMLSGPRVSYPQILVLKQQTPSPAELGGAVVLDPRPPGQRAAEDAAAMEISSDSLPVSWCSLGQESFTVSPFAPQGYVYELRKDRWVDPAATARVWGRETAATHLTDPRRAELLARITPELPKQLADLCENFVNSMRRDLEAFCKDPRAAQDRLLEDASINGWLDRSSGARAGGSRKL